MARQQLRMIHFCQSFGTYIAFGILKAKSKAILRRDKMTSCDLEQIRLGPRCFESVVGILAFLLIGWGDTAVASEGGKIYKQSCAVCHADGVPGTPEAPKVGSRNDPKFAADWYRRLFAGREALLHSVLNGKGAMPPKGGDASLSDTQAEAALDYMLSQIESPP